MVSHITLILRPGNPPLNQYFHVGRTYFSHGNIFPGVHSYADLQPTDVGPSPGSGIRLLPSYD